MPTNIDILLFQLQKHGELDQETCLTFLTGYTHKQNALRALTRHVQRGIIYRRRENHRVYYGLVIQQREFDENQHKQPVVSHPLEDWAKLYRYFVRYGAQHFGSPGRVNFMAVMRSWLREYDDLVQFPMLLRDLLTRDVSHLEFQELEKGLAKAGWYMGEWDSAHEIGHIIGILNPAFEIRDYLDYPQETWQRLYDLDGLGRFNNTGEQIVLPPAPEPHMTLWAEYKNAHKDKWSVTELGERWHAYLRDKDR